jgi:hypothetical protein
MPTTALPTKGAFPPGPPLAPPGPAHRHLASLMFSASARVYLGGDDTWLWEFSTDAPRDPFSFPSPLFALLSPHLQLKLMADVARWVLCGGAPSAPSAAHCAALWAALEFLRAPLDIEGDEAPASEAPQPRPPSPPRAPRQTSNADGVALMMLQGRLSSMHEAAAVVAAEGGDLEARGLANLPPVPATPDDELRTRREQYERERRAMAAVPPGLAGIVVSPLNPRPALPPVLVAPWNLHRHALVSAFQEYVQALFQLGGRAPRRVELAVNADACKDRDINFMLSTCFRCIVGELGGAELLRGACQLEDVQRLRSLQALAAKLNSAFEAALAHDPALLARAAAQLVALSVHGTLHTSLLAPAAMRPGCEAYAAALAAWTAADAARGIDTRKAYDGCFPCDFQLSVEAQEAEGEGRRRYLLGVAAAAAARAAGGGGGSSCSEGAGGGSGGERLLHVCVAERLSAEGGGSLSFAARDEVLVASCGSALGGLLDAAHGTSSSTISPKELQRLRFERMLGQYHEAMAAAAAAQGGGGGSSASGGGDGGGGGGSDGSAAALERAYGCFETRLRAAGAVRHPVAPLWLELESPAQYLAEVRKSTHSAGLRCDACQLVLPVEELHACSACRAARYCSRACQRKDWKDRHKSLCALVRANSGGEGGGGGGGAGAT